MPPRDELDRQVDVYRSYSATTAQSHWGADEVAAHPDPAAVAEHLADTAREAGADCLNLRIHAPEISPAAVRDQLVALGDEVLPRLRPLLP